MAQRNFTKIYNLVDERKSSRISPTFPVLLSCGRMYRSTAWAMLAELMTEKKQLRLENSLTQIACLGHHGKNLEILAQLAHSCTRRFFGAVL